MAHCNTIFSELLSQVPGHVFSKLERQYDTGRKPRVFSRWQQFASLAFIQLAGRPSMRDAIRNLQANSRRLYHAGMKPVARSTFSDANNKRPADFFQALFGELYQRCEALSPVHKFRFKNKLFSLDASTISLCLNAFPWASFRKNRGGIKLHTLLDHDGYIPAMVVVTDAKTHESQISKVMRLPKGSIVTFDKGFTDYCWYYNLVNSGVHFVTRLKTNACYKVLKRRPVNKKQGVTSDQEILLKSTAGQIRLRRIGYRDPQTAIHYQFLTSHFTLSAKTIADIYKDRWQVEIFFRLIKQTLKIKSFVGNSENAVLSQIYVAMITHLLLAYLKFTSKIGWSLQQIIQLIQSNIFLRTCLHELLKPPEKIPENIDCYPLLNL